MVGIPDALRPRVYTVRSKMNANLTGAKTAWSPYGERSNVKAAWTVLFGLSFFLIIVAGTVFGGLVLVGLTALWASLVAVISTAVWWDEKAWQGPKIQAGDLEPRPFIDNMHIWFRQWPDPNAATPVPTLTPQPQKERKEPEEYGIIFETEPKGFPAVYRGNFPPDTDVFVARVLEDAHPLIDRERRGLRGERKETLSREARGKGVGYWHGSTYRLPGTPIPMVLGSEEWAEEIRSERIRKAILMCPEDLRNEIYRLCEHSKPWRRVYFFEDQPIVKLSDRPMYSIINDRWVQERAELLARLNISSGSQQKLTEEIKSLIDLLRRK